ncbi:E3 ubiquitin-protein ligase [Thalictrum thalictroides]|uniref:E3 ubiquitin-protein ligase n=1 Tax=Thalictrum thalictroides TaxID=46969 RepID=A0A7J6UVY7_THATH|nr:E3 ubiquitin-protein ligase [Thalictrum thalictroides]
MAGMLPGVECARRRRCHQGGWMEQSQSFVGHGRTRRFCLYTSNHESQLNSKSLLERSAANQSFQGDKLEGAAREAKERLDERLRFQRKSETKSLNRKGNMKTDNSESVLGSVILGLHTEVYSSKKGTAKRFGWGKLRWKAVDQDECAVCLERFKSGETLLHLPCAHRFHSMCLVPWLENNAHCPCCRTDIILNVHL